MSIKHPSLDFLDPASDPRLVEGSSGNLHHREYAARLVSVGLSC